MYAQPPPSHYQAPVKGVPIQHQSQYPPQQQYPPQPQYPTVSHGNTPGATGGVYVPTDAVQHGIPLYGASCTPSQKKFVTRGARDVWAAVLFYLVFIGVVVGGAYNMATSNLSLDSLNFEWMASFNDIIIYACISVISAIALSALSICMFQLCATACIIFAYITSILYFIGAAIFMGIIGSWMSSIIFGLLAALRICMFFAYRSYIPISATILRRASILVKEYPGTSIFNVIMVLVLGVWGIFWVAMLIPIVLSIQTGISIMSILIPFSLFALFWTVQVLQNVSHVTTAGVTATWYFCSGTGMPNTPSPSSFKRAMTTSFGSVCLGSLIVAILQLIRAMIKSAADQGGGFCGAIAYCLISCIESLVRLFNKFAYVYCAMYGYSFVEAAKATFDLVKRSAFEALWNSILSETTLILFSFLIGVVVGVVAGLFKMNIMIGVISGVIAISVSSLIFKVVGSGVTTIFVCLAEEPQSLSASDPEFYSEMTAAAERSEPANNKHNETESNYANHA